MIIDLMGGKKLEKYTNSKLVTVLYKQLQDGLENFKKEIEINKQLKR